MNSLIEQLERIGLEYETGTMMKDITTFRIGGPADVIISPRSVEELKNAVKIIRDYEMDFIILGKGSNILVSDRGYRGAVISLYKNFSEIRVSGETIYADAGATMTRIAKAAYENSLEGFEFASGIPGTVGGGLIMNAGAYGGEMKDVVKSVKVLNEDLSVSELTNEEMKFRYRESVVKNTKKVVIGVELALKKGDKEKIRKTLDELAEKRNANQPLNKGSAGSTFKRPKGDFAARLIEAAGLKGLRHGDAEVSGKHAGFIVNNGKAGSKEVRELIELVKATVRKTEGKNLEEEVIYIGEFDEQR